MSVASQAPTADGLYASVQLEHEMQRRLAARCGKYLCQFCNWGLCLQLTVVLLLLQKGLTLPSVQLDLDAIEHAFAQHLPVVEVCKPAGSGRHECWGTSSHKRQLGSLA